MKTVIALCLLAVAVYAQDAVQLPAGPTGEPCSDQTFLACNQNAHPDNKCYFDSARPQGERHYCWCNPDCYDGIDCGNALKPGDYSCLFRK